ncbi:NAD(P)-binding protein [Vararia minispora EC-137]|uniref:NAD(P)-binding protein n=1 Tax=Vararia minispora EC-137 TaxID=1314806 RepID=A0ACB8QJL5_9AGAM|nr:NAD(P)-binding protein [Vararia minispora EC-137]
MGGSSSRFLTGEGLQDLTDRVAIVTGASSGIGLYISFYLVLSGAKVYMAARSHEKTAAAIRRLKDEGLHDGLAEKMIWLPFDLTDPRQAKASAEQFLKLEQRLDILAPLMFPRILGPYGQTSTGISDSLVINHISPFVFTETLLPVLEHTASLTGSDVRIVNVSSVAHRWISNPRYDSFEALNSDFARTMKPSLNLYAYTKLANILWTKELQRRFELKAIPIVTMAVHPGNVMSEGNVKLFKSWPCGSFVGWFFSLFFLRENIGGYTPAWAAASSEVAADSQRFKGAYVVPYGSIVEASKDARREDLAKDLWAMTERLLAQYNWH